MALPTSSIISQSTLAAQVASLLPGLAPATALENESLRQALQEFIERGNTTFQNEITIWLGSRKRKKRASNRSHLEVSAWKFFERRKQARAKSSQGPLSWDLVQGVLCLRDACNLPANEYSIRWERARKAMPDEHNGANRQKRVMGKEYISESKSWAAETERRIVFLHVDYEVTRLELQHNGASIDATGSVHDAEHEFSNLAEVDVNQTRARRASARPHLCFAKHDCGLGYLLMLGTQTRKQWERTITNEGISWILQFCEEEEELRSVLELARKLQPLACTIVEEGFCGTDKGELRETGHIFSAHFKSRDFSQVNSGLETLAAAANVMQSCAFPVERRDSAIASQLQLNEAPYPVSSTQILHGTAPSAVYSEPHADLSQRPMVPQNDSTHFSHLHHCDDQAVELLGGAGGSWTNGYLTSSGEPAEPRLAASGLANSSYLPMNGNVTSEALPHWRPLNQAQDMWQGNDMAPEELAEWDAFWSGLSQPQQFDSIVT